MECTCNKSGADRLVFSYGSFVGDLYIDDFKLTALSSGNSYVPMPADQKKAVLTEAMEKWIDGMMAVTARKVSAWDVVNEAISDRDHDGDGYYDDSYTEASTWTWHGTGAEGHAGGLPRVG